MNNLNSKYSLPDTGSSARTAGNPDSLCYTRSFSVTSTMVDMDLRMRLSTLFSLLQEAAFENTVRLGIGRDKTLDRGLLWVVTHYSANIHRMPRYDEHITLTTWPGRTMHLFFPRYWQITDHSGRPLVDVSSMWALISKEERKVIFPDQYDIRMPGAATGRELPIPKRPRLPELTRQASFTIPPSYVDMNGHMNNTRYFDVVQDLLPISFFHREPREISMEYVNEVLLGQTLQIRYETTDSRVCILGETDQVIFRMILAYEPET